MNLALQLDGAGRILGFDLRDFLLRGSALGANQALGAGVPGDMCYAVVTSEDCLRFLRVRVPIFEGA